jgi:hypothetical protein
MSAIGMPSNKRNSDRRQRRAETRCAADDRRERQDDRDQGDIGHERRRWAATRTRVAQREEQNLRGPPLPTFT